MNMYATRHTLAFILLCPFQSTSLKPRDVCGPKTTVIIGNEERDAFLQAHFVEELGKLFTIRPVRRKKVCDLAGYHDLVQLWICKLRRPKKGSDSGGGGGGGSAQQEQEQHQEEAEEAAAVDENVVLAPAEEAGAEFIFQEQEDNVM